MKKLYKIVLSVLLTLVLISTAISANIKEKERTSDAAKDIPASINPTATEATEQAYTYTDIWTTTNPYHFWPSLNTWRDVSGMRQTINLRYPSTVIVQFSSEVGTKVVDDFGASASGILVRATIDGNIMPPGNVIFSENSDMESNTFTFKWDYLSAGTHVIKIQANKYAVIGDGAAGDLWRKSMTVIANGYGH